MKLLILCTVWSSSRGFRWSAAPRTVSPLKQGTKIFAWRRCSTHEGWDNQQVKRKVCCDSGYFTLHSHCWFRSNTVIWIQQGNKFIGNNSFLAERKHDSIMKTVLQNKTSPRLGFPQADPLCCHLSLVRRRAARVNWAQDGFWSQWAEETVHHQRNIDTDGLKFWRWAFCFFLNKIFKKKNVKSCVYLLPSDPGSVVSRISCKSFQN